jgi:long-chain acyl-CoA synthetase
MEGLMNFSESTIAGIFLNRAEKYHYRTCIRHKEDGKYKDISFTEMKRNVMNLGLGLISLGVRKGDIVTIFSENRWEWLVSDLAILSIGAADAPIYSTCSGEEAAYIINDSGSKVVFVSNKEHLDRLLSVKSRIKGVKKIICFENAAAKGKSIITFSDVIETGASAKDRKIFETCIGEIEPQDLATLIYTAGTTGNPKGVMLTHDNIVTTVHQCHASHPMLSQNDETLSLLPWSHSLGRIVGIYLMYHVGAVISLAESFATALTNLVEIRPTLLVSVPRIFEKMYSSILSKEQNSPPLRQKLFNWAKEVADRSVDYIVQKKQIPFGLRIQYDLAEKLVFSRIRAALGLDRLTVSVNGGGPLANGIERFFNGAGIALHNGYGLTETSTVTNTNTFDAFEFGSVGRPVAETKVKLADDGEILIKGPQVMKGYWEKPDETKAAFDSEGWLMTGDIGRIDERGFLYITDRKKDIIITSGAKNISPQNIENTLITDAYIEQAVVVGEGRKYLSALIVPNYIELSSWARSERLTFDSNEELVSRPDVIEFYRKRIENAMKKYARVEQIRKFRLLSSEFSIDGGELTPTLKLKRKFINEKYSDVIEGMYLEEKGE